MDIKITGVTFEIMRDALAQAKEGRMFILGKMDEASTRRARELSEYAPRISTIQIDPDKIGLLIGQGGKTIRALRRSPRRRSTSTTTARCSSTRPPAPRATPSSTASAR